MLPLPALTRIRTTNVMLSTEQPWIDLSRPDVSNGPCEGYVPATAPSLLRGWACARELRRDGFHGGVVCGVSRLRFWWRFLSCS